MKELLRILTLCLTFTALLSGCSSAHSDRDVEPALDPFTSDSAPNCRNCGYVFDGWAKQVLDGDTIVILTEDNKLLTVRLKGIDAPERSQPYGSEAQAYLTKLTTNRTLRMIWSKMDRYKRLIGKVEVLETKEEDLCLQMIQAGYAWHYKQFESEQDDEDRITYSNEEKKAREARLGLWNSTASPVPPWDFRHRQEKNTMNDDNNGDDNRTKPRQSR